jgi:hypothetical protein
MKAKNLFDTGGPRHLAYAEAIKHSEALIDEFSQSQAAKRPDAPGGFRPAGMHIAEKNAEIVARPNRIKMDF